MKKTKIEWCDSTWNPVTGCLHGCEYCYARKIARRFCSNEHGKEGLLAPCNGDCKACSNMDGLEFLLSNVRICVRGQGSYPYGFMPTFHRYRLDEPSQWTKPRTIFVCSMADLFGEWVPDKWIEEVFEACGKAPQHRYLFLTKNPDRYCELANSGKLPKLNNFWYGTTVTNKDSKFFGGSIQHNTFISVEPLLSSLNAGIGSFSWAKWIIIGAETGKRRNKIVPEKDWIDNICEAANLTRAKIFMKDSLIPIVGEENMRREFPWMED